MNSEQLAHFKNKLEAEAAEIEGELSKIAKKDPNQKGNWDATPGDIDVMNPLADANEAADKIEEFEENQIVTDALEVRHKEIKIALAKMEEGTYGTCEISGEAIEEDRLHANPAARTCKEHMSQEEDLA
jgi:RNA polymerase-binding transcription factor DksA